MRSCIGKMFAHCVVLIIAIFIASFGSAEPLIQKGPGEFSVPGEAVFRAPPHAHSPAVTGLSAAHADRFMGMFYVAQCDIEMAAEYFVHALLHNATDPEILNAPKEAGNFLGVMSNRFLERGREEERFLDEELKRHGTRFAASPQYKMHIHAILIKYAWSLKCNPRNVDAVKNFDRMFIKEQSVRKK